MLLALKNGGLEGTGGTRDGGTVAVILNVHGEHVSQVIVESGYGPDNRESLFVVEHAIRHLERVHRPGCLATEHECLLDGGTDEHGLRRLVLGTVAALAVVIALVAGLTVAVVYVTTLVNHLIVPLVGGGGSDS